MVPRSEVSHVPEAAMQRNQLATGGMRRRHGRHDRYSITGTYEVKDASPLASSAAAKA